MMSMEENKKKPKKHAAHRSIFLRVVAIFIVLGLIVMVLDPMTPNVNEGEIIYRIAFYPYFKAKSYFEEEVEDYDKDGIPDYDEIHGWKMMSDVITLSQAGEKVSYNFTLERKGEYFFSFRYSSQEETSVSFSLNDETLTTNLNATEGKFEVELIFSKIELSPATMELSVQLNLNKSIKIDWLKIQKIGEFCGVVLDADDYSYPSDSSLKSTEEITYITDWKNPDSDFDEMLDGYELVTGRMNGGWTEPMVTNKRYAVLIGGGSPQQEKNYLAFANAVLTVYDALHNTYGYLDENIYVLFWDGKPLSVDIVDSDGSLASISSTFDLLSTKATKNDLLFVYLTSHGNYNETYQQGIVAVYADPEKNPVGEDPLTYRMLASNISKVHAGVKILVIEACNSGSAILDFKKEDGVQIYTSSKKEDETFAYPNGNPPFTYHFMQALTNPIIGSIPTFEEIKNLDVELEEKEFISVGEAYKTTIDKLKLSLTDNPFEEWKNQTPQQNDVAEEIGKQTYL